MAAAEHERSGARSALITLIDIVTLLGSWAAIEVARSGGGRLLIGALRISVRDPWRIAMWTSALAIFRWAVWRRVRPMPSLRLRPWTRRLRRARARIAPVFSWSKIRENAGHAPAAAASAWLRFAGIGALVVAQPVFDTLARSPEFLVAHEASRADIVATAAFLILVIPTLLAIPVLAARVLGRVPQQVTESAIVGALATVFALQICRHTGVQTATIAIPIAALAGLLTAFAYARAAGVRAVASAASFSALVVPVLFFTTPSIRALVAASPQNESARTAFASVHVDPDAAVPIVLLIFDETPLLSLLDADRKIDPDLFPSFATLARDGVFFRNATTVSDYTQWAVPAILSGRYPRATAAPTAADYDETVYTLLGGTYQFAVSEPLTHLCPASICPPVLTPWPSRLAVLWSDLRYAYLHAISTPDLARGLPSLTDNWRDFGELGQRRREGREERARRRPGGINEDLATDLLDRIDADPERPSFFVLHTLLGHFPHLQLPSGRVNGTRAAVPAFASTTAWNRDGWAILQLHQRHLLTMRFVDGWLGRFIDRLRSTNLYERALVIVTADHGISFEPGTPRRDFSASAAAQIMRVPLIVKFPVGMVPSVPAAVIGGQHVSDRNAQTIDILPTIADVLNVAIPWRVDGVSLADATLAEPPKKIMFFDSARKTATFDRAGPDLSDALTRKLAAFEECSDSASCVPQPDRFRALVGRPVRELSVTGGGGRVEVDYLARFEHFDATAEETPFDVGGRFDHARPPHRVTYIAVAVNGVVAAVTRTWDSNPSGWLATPAPSAWRKGRNYLQVFVIDGDEHAPALRRCDLRAGGP